MNITLKEDNTSFIIPRLLMFGKNMKNNRINDK